MPWKRESRVRYGVIGAGALGLTVALRLSERVQETGGEIVHGATASGIRRDGGGVVVTVARDGHEEAIAFDRVVSTLPTALARDAG